MCWWGCKSSLPDSDDQNYCLFWKILTVKYYHISLLPCKSQIPAAGRDWLAYMQIFLHKRSSLALHYILLVD